MTFKENNGPALKNKGPINTNHDIDKDPELKAYIHQRLNELEPYLPPMSSINIDMSAFDKKDQNTAYETKVEVNLPIGPVEFLSTSTEPYEAVNTAIDELKNSLIEIQSTGSNGSIRNQVIDAIIQNRLLH